MRRTTHIAASHIWQVEWNFGGCGAWKADGSDRRCGSYDDLGSLTNQTLRRQTNATPRAPLHPQLQTTLNYRPTEGAPVRPI